MAQKLSRVTPRPLLRVTSSTHPCPCPPPSLFQCRNPSSSFSTSSNQQYPRSKKDQNPNRGVSFLRRSGLREPVSVSKYPLPKPVLDPKLRQTHQTDEDHPLWQFFGKNKARVPTPSDEIAHGRAWSLQELRRKSWEDLHCLWWVCVRERNRLATAIEEFRRLDDRPGSNECTERARVIKQTQKYIKWVLTERWYAFEDARKLAETDEGIDLGEYAPDLDGQGAFMEPTNAEVTTGKSESLRTNT